MVPQNNPDAACMDEIKMTGEKEQSTGKPFAHHTTTPAIFLQAEQISISSFVLRTQQAVYMLDDMLAQANSVCLPAWSRSDRPVLALLLVARVDCAVPYCAVLAVFAVLAARGYHSRYPAATCS